MVLIKPRNVSKKEFGDVFKKGINYSGKYLFLKHTKSDNNLAISYIVPVSVSKKSTERNKLKRRARAITRDYIKYFKKGSTLVFFKKGSEGIKTNDLKRDLMELYKKSGLINNY